MRQQQALASFQEDSFTSFLLVRMAGAPAITITGASVQPMLLALWLDH